MTGTVFTQLARSAILFTHTHTHTHAHTLTPTHTHMDNESALAPAKKRSDSALVPAPVPAPEYQDTREGFWCGACPEGWTGNGTVCGDINELVG